MYQYIWDAETGGLLLTSEQSKFSKEPRPVYYKELDILGFDRYWTYPKDDAAPIMWAEANNYIYKGRTIARTKGGSLYTAPELIVLDDSDGGSPLQFVDIPAMVEKNRGLLETLVQDTIQKIYNNFWKYHEKVDVFYVAYSGGKDSEVALDLVQRALPHNDFMVLFGDTQMEFPDTYRIVEETQCRCRDLGIRFLIAKSEKSPLETWHEFGPPSTTNRWCCSVHKTSPQILRLRKYLDKNDFTGMAFTGVRAEESVGRSEYDSISQDKKHKGQMSFHVILEWSSAEVFLYIYSFNLPMSEVYKKGIARAGCLVCPNSIGKNEYYKYTWYQQDVDKFLQIIASTSGKTNYSDSDMRNFIDSGFWRTRKTGRELNFGQDDFEIKLDSNPPEILVYKKTLDWKKWALTVGDYYQDSNGIYVFKFFNKLYQIKVYNKNDVIHFCFLNYCNEKNDIKFFSLFRSVIVKSLFCVGCGVCEAECKHACIDMSQGISISGKCVHCYNCHNIHEHCLRYNSIRNKRTEAKIMSGIDRYFSFGIRQTWLEIYCKYNGEADFWESDGDGIVANKKKDAFRNFVLDAGLATYNKKVVGDKYTKCIPTSFTKIVKELGCSSDTSWALILCNLCYTPAFNWFAKTLVFGYTYTPDYVKTLLGTAMENDLKGLGKRNVLDAFKFFMAETPLGTSHIFADCDIDVRKNGLNESITLNSFQRCPWQNPVPEVILYSLYKFAEACGEYYQFTLETLLDDSVERDGVSPTRIFGLDRETMIRILNGLAVNYPAFISVSFTLDLDNITLRSEKTAADVLQLF